METKTVLLKQQAASNKGGIMSYLMAEKGGTVKKEDLDKIVKNHGDWLADVAGGIRADLREADLRGADLSGANLSGAHLRGADLSGANLFGAHLRGADLSEADLREADLSGADLSGANLSGANLRGANLSGANLSWADLSGANLSGANLRGADLSEADVRFADLRGANLSGANLSEANLRGAKTNKKYLIVSCIGSRKDSTTYCVDDDMIWCGCFKGTLSEFETRVHEEYPEGQYRKEYDAAIAFFETIRGGR